MPTGEGSDIGLAAGSFEAEEAFDIQHGIGVQARRRGALAESLATYIQARDGVRAQFGRLPTPPLRSSIALRSPSFFALASLSLAACARISHQAGPEPVDLGTQVMPTVYLTERFFVRPVTMRGDTLTLFTDTGDNGRLFQASIEKLGWQVDTVKTARGDVMLADLPAFKPSRSIPASMPAPVNKTRMIVAPPIDRFDTLMSARAIGQLGQPWFAGRIWTFDYPGKRLLLHAQAPARRARDREIRFEYLTDTAGKPISSTPRLGVEIEGDSLLLIFDTGATVWLTDSAMTVMRDGRPAERSWSLVRNATYRSWRAKHPEWRVIERANQVNGGDMIEVPSMRIAGFDVGPVWFGTIPDRPANARPAPLRIRIDGTLGGDALRFFSVTVDYPAQAMVFRPTAVPARQTNGSGGK